MSVKKSYENGPLTSQLSGAKQIFAALNTSTSSGGATSSRTPTTKPFSEYPMLRWHVRGAYTVQEGFNPKKSDKLLRQAELFYMITDPMT